MSHWLLDLGNTRLKYARLLEDGSIAGHGAIAHAEPGFEEALERVLPARLDAAFVASVAPALLRQRLLRVLAGRCGRISIAASAARFGRLRIAYPEPRRLGGDRFLAMLATTVDGGGPALVCSIGTALTLDLVDAEGQHRGGRIAPSPTLMRESLHGRAPHLPQAGGRFTEFADDTADALASGCLGAAAALVERSLALAGERIEGRPRLLLHGGGAPELQPLLPAARHRPLLVLEGLAQWARVQAGC